MTDGSDLIIDEEKWREYVAELPRWTKRAMLLYRRCQLFRDIALPEAGGVLDQSERLVQILQEIHAVKLQYDARRQKDADFKLRNDIFRMEVESSSGGRVRSLR
jgi:hypothetical protein